MFVSWCDCRLYGRGETKLIVVPVCGHVNHCQEW